MPSHPFFIHSFIVFSFLFFCLIYGLYLQAQLVFAFEIFNSLQTPKNSLVLEV